MENEILITDNNSVEYNATMPAEFVTYKKNLGFSADDAENTSVYEYDEGITVIGAEIIVNDNFGKDVMLDGSVIDDYYFSDTSSFATVDASQTNYNMRIYGNDKNNVIIGGNGENTLSGGASGTNSITGGSARDYFAYNGIGRTSISNFTAGRNNKSDVIFFVGDAPSSIQEITRNASVVRMRFGADTSHENYVSLIGAGSDDSIIQYAVENDPSIKYAKIGRSSLTYDDEVSYFQTNAGGSIKVTGENSVNIWMDGSRGQYFQGITVLNASNSSGYNTLAGNAGAATSIVGGSGNSSLWGGSGMVDDTLVGGNGAEMFWYGRFEGNDIIQNAASNDSVYLYDTKLEQVTALNVENSQIKIRFESNTSLTVNCKDDVSPVFILENNERWNYNRSTGNWNQV